MFACKRPRPLEVCLQSALARPQARGGRLEQLRRIAVNRWPLPQDWPPPCAEKRKICRLAASHLEERVGREEHRRVCWFLRRSLSYLLLQAHQFGPLRGGGTPLLSCFATVSV